MSQMCRACLSLEKLLQPVDDNFIYGYNILTNISIIKSDGLSQFTCTSCLESVENFMLFRDKCIESENTLKHILSEAVDSKEGIIKDVFVDESNIKQELQVKEEIDIEIQPGFDDNDDIDSQAHENQDMIQYGIEQRKAEDIISIKQNKLKKSRMKNKSKKLMKSKENMVSILKMMSADNNVLCCGMCSKKFEDRIKLNEHLETHKNYKECKLCWVKFHEWPSLLAHRITHINRLKEKRCHYCNKLFKSVSKLELHYRLMHYDGENKMISCKYCSKSFSSARKLNRHTSASHVKLQMYQCDHCKKLISSKPGLVTHLRKHSEDRPFKCDLCDYSCKYTSGVRAHKMRKHSATKVVYCKTCGRDFASTELLDKHNCKSRATMCPICGVIKSKQLTVHMATHHMGVLFKCELCPAEFKSKNALKVHTEKHSGNRRYSCEFCSMKFFVSAVLKKHRRVHTGEKPFVCNICQRGFTGKHNLKVHMKVHGEDLIVKRVKNTSGADDNTRSDLFYTTK